MAKLVKKIKKKFKSSMKKRFSLTGTGKIRRNRAKKRHGMTKLSSRSVRQLRGTTILSKGDDKRIRMFII